MAAETAATGQDTGRAPGAVTSMSLSSVFDHPTLSGAAIIAAKTAVVYLFLVAGLRLFGKRELGQMSLYDLVLIIILGNAVQNAMINNDNTLVGGIVAAVVLFTLNWGLNQVMTTASSPRRASASTTRSGSVTASWRSGSATARTRAPTRGS